MALSDSAGTFHATDVAQNIELARRLILPSEEAAAAVRSGIMRAAQDLQAWGEFWPCDRGCENVLQVRAAEELIARIRKHGPGWITLEEPISYVRMDSRAKRGRPFNNMSDQQRADIALWTKGELIYALVEVKRAQDEADWICDVEKLCKQIKTFGRTNGKLRYGVFGAYISSEVNAKIDDRAHRLKDLANEIACRFGLKARTKLHDVRHAWEAMSADGLTCAAASVVLSYR